MFYCFIRINYKATKHDVDVKVSILLVYKKYNTNNKNFPLF